jgi:Restriction endonuclease
MLENVVGAYLDSLQKERQFDAPLLALLRANGFRRVHLTHGAFEFGKDAIAQKEVDGVLTQFAFQSKAGDVSLAGWRALYSQVEELRTNALSHPDFARGLPRRAILVLTGRLTGGASPAIQEHARNLEARGEVPLEVWDRERLIEKIVGKPEALVDAFSGPLLGLLGDIDQLEVTDRRVEEFSRAWVDTSGATPWRAALEASIIAKRLADTHRLDLACYTALCLVRAAWASTHGISPPSTEALAIAGAAGEQFELYARELLGEDLDELLDQRRMALEGAGLLAGYAIRCVRIAEIAGLLGLRKDGAEREQIARWLARFVMAQPGCAHPISDRWAVSLAPAATLLAGSHPEALEHLLIEAMRWLGDFYADEGLGLAGLQADPREEIDYLIGGALEHVDRPRRSGSNLVALLLDLASAFEKPAAYDAIHNDALAVEAHPLVGLPLDDSDQYRVNGRVPVNTSPNYAQSWDIHSEWRQATHHDDDPSRSYLGRVGRPWDQLAISAVTRDRYWLWAVRQLRKA